MTERVRTVEPQPAQFPPSRSKPGGLIRLALPQILQSNWTSVSATLLSGAPESEDVKDGSPMPVVYGVQYFLRVAERFRNS